MPVWVFIVQKNMQGGDLYDLQYCWDCNISVVFPNLGLNAAKIIHYIEKRFKWKLCRIKFLEKKSVGVYLYPPPNGAMGRQRIAIYWNRKVGSFWGWMLPKVPILLKNASNKNCRKLNFVQKTLYRHKSSSLREWSWRHQKFAIFEMHWNGKLGSLRAECCQKYRLYRKML